MPGAVRIVSGILVDKNINGQFFEYFMRQNKREWEYREWTIPANIDAELWNKLCRPKPLTKKQKNFLEQIEKIFEEARKWKKKNR